MHKAREQHTNKIVLVQGTVCVPVQNDIVVATNCVLIHVARSHKSEPETEIPRGTSKSILFSMERKGENCLLVLSIEIALIHSIEVALIHSTEIALRALIKEKKKGKRKRALTWIRGRAPRRA